MGLTTVNVFHIKPKPYLIGFVLTHELYLRQVKNKKQITHFSTGILVFEDGTKFLEQVLATKDMRRRSLFQHINYWVSRNNYRSLLLDQIINFTFPHIGNVGTNIQDNEADKAWAKGVILNCDVTEPSNYRSIKKLDKWLKKERSLEL